MSDVDLGALYCEARTAFTAAVGDLDDSSLGKKLPACPAWTAKDLIGHVTGIIDDVTNGRLEGAGSDAWTELQTTAAKDLSVDELMTRFGEQAPPLEALLSAAPPSVMTARLVIDIVTHQWDLAGLTGRRPERGASFVFALEAYASTFGQRITKNELPALALSTGDWSYVAGAGEPDFSVEADPVEFFRGFSGRRSERQVLLWDWDGEPRPYLEIVSHFGDLASAEVNEAY